MAVYKYTAVTSDGTQVKAVADGPSRSFVENDLMRQNLTVLKIREKKSLAQFEISPERVPRQEIMHFSRQMAAFVRSGIPITDAVRIVEQSTENKRFQTILADVREQLQAGVPFSQALEGHGTVLPPYYLGIVRSAELTGQLDVVLDQLAIYIERDMEARSRVKSALTYPAVVMFMSIVTMIVMVSYVLPKFVVFFEELDAKLPLPTRMLLGFSHAFTTWWWLLALIVVGTVAGFYYSGKTEAGLMARHRFFLGLPVIGVIVQYSAVERFCRIIAAMMRAGVPLPEAMAASIESTKNEVFKAGLRRARDEMLEGEGMAGPLARTELFPAAAVQMIRVGEETGTLDQQIDASADFYARELEYKLKRLTDLFEPAVIIFMGVVVGFVAVALMSAMYGVLQTSKDI